MVNLILAQIPAATNASSVVNGNTYLSTDPDVPTVPKAWGVNDRALGFYASKFATLSAALTAISSTKARLYVDSNLTVSNSLTIPENVTLVYAGGIISTNVGQVLTVNSHVDCPATQFFAGAGTVDFTANNRIGRYLPEWLGAVGDGVTDDGPAFNKLQIAKPQDAPIYPSPNRTYAIATTIDNNNTPLIIKGDGIVGSSDQEGVPLFLYTGAAGGTMINCDGKNYIKLVGFAMIAKSGASEADNAIKINNAPGIGPEAKVIIDHLFINFPGVRSTFKGINLSETATANVENVSITNTKIFASNDTSFSNPNRGTCIYQGLNTNAIVVTLDHVWLRAANVALHVVGGNSIAIRNSFLMESDVAIQANTDFLVENVRFESVRAYHKATGGTPRITYINNTLDLFGLATATPAFDFTGANPRLIMLNNDATGSANAAQVWFTLSGGNSARLFSRNNNYPTTSALNHRDFSAGDSGLDFGIVQNGFMAWTGGEGHYFRHFDPIGGGDQLPKIQVDGHTTYTRIGQHGEDGNWLTNLYGNGSVFAKDDAAKGAWWVNHTLATADANNLFRLMYAPVGSVVPASLFEVNGQGKAGITSLALGGGTELTKAVVYSPTLTPVAIAANTSAEQDFTVNGLTTTDKVILNGPAPTAGTAIVNVRVKSANTLSITFGNFTAGSLTPASGAYQIIAVRS
jgi:hypothetical protein